MTSAGVLALDRLDERAVDQAELEVLAPVPHREWRRFDQVRERIERPFGLAQAEREPGPLLFARAGVEEPQQQRARRLGRRRRPAADVEYARRTVRAQLAAKPGRPTSGPSRRRRAGDRDRRAQCRCHCRRDRSAPWAAFKTEVAQQLGIGFDLLGRGGRATAAPASARARWRWHAPPRGRSRQAGSGAPRQSRSPPRRSATTGQAPRRPR